LKFFIVHLPKNATSVDMFYARRIQEIVSRQKKEDFETSILFIGKDDHKKLIN